jgi:hypothetical protein
MRPRQTSITAEPGGDSPGGEVEPVARRRSGGKAGKANPLPADIPGIKERVLPHQVLILALEGKLPSESLAHLATLRKGRRKLWFTAVVNGTRGRLKAQYKARWAAATHKPVSAFAEALGAEAYWRRASENIVKLGISVERFLDVAWNARGRNMLAPTLQQLGGPALVSTIQGGGDGIRDRVGLIDGMSLDTLIERSIEAGAWPRDLDAYRRQVGTADDNE